jgi:hypothetical protein
MSAHRNRDASRASCRQRIRAAASKKLDPCHAPNVRDEKCFWKSSTSRLGRLAWVETARLDQSWQGAVAGREACGRLQKKSARSGRGLHRRRRTRCSRWRGCEWLGVAEGGARGGWGSAAAARV